MRWLGQGHFGSRSLEAGKAVHSFHQGA